MFLFHSIGLIEAEGGRWINRQSFIGFSTSHKNLTKVFQHQKFPNYWHNPYESLFWSEAVTLLYAAVENIKSF